MKAKLNHPGIAWFAIGILLLSGCKKEPDPVNLPTLETSFISEITVTSATISVFVFSDGGSEVTERGVCWSRDEEPTINDTKTIEGKGLGKFVSRITGLTPNTDYYVRAFASNIDGTEYGSVLTFHTPLKAIPATLEALDVSAVTVNSAIANGNIKDNGGGEITEKGFCWSTDPFPTTANAKRSGGSGLGSFYIKLTGLNPGTLYYVRAYAVNEAGVSYSDELNFKTYKLLGTRSKDLPGDERSGAVSFSVGTKVYLGLGNSNSGLLLADFWEWNQATETWIRLADFPEDYIEAFSGFSIGEKGYIATLAQNIDGTLINEFWEYDPSSDHWTRKANIPVMSARKDFECFSIGSKGYIGLGTQFNYDDWEGVFLRDFWEWDQATDIWTRKTDFPGEERAGAVSFSIGNKGYIGTGQGYSYFVDFWEWDQATDTWTMKADFAGNARAGAIGFSVGGKGYVGLGTGFDGIVNNPQDFWEWDQETNKWSKIGDFIGGPRIYSVGFSVGDKGYVGTGTQIDFGTLLKDFWILDL